jgi:DNA-binding response OmpR family regulator
MGKRILIVDNLDSQRRHIYMTAREAGFDDDSIVQAGDQESAEQLIKEDEYDVAVVDLNLTEGRDTREGLDVIKTLRSRQPGCWIIGLTTTLKDDGPEVYSYGGNDFIYTGWAYINWMELLRNRLEIFRKAPSPSFAVR